MHIDSVNFSPNLSISLNSLKRPSLTIATGIIVLGAVLSLGFIGEFDAFAKKPSNTPDWKIWDLHGEHSVLNVHGKKDTHQCNNSNEGIEPYGSSIFVLEYGTSQINFVSNKRSNIDHLQVIDPCAAPFGVNGNIDPALVQLPTGDHQVYVRILGKPNNGGGGQTGEPSTAKISSPRIIQLCDLQENDPNAETRTDCDKIDENDEILPLGLVTNNGGVFGLADDGITLERWEDPTPTKGKGKSKAYDITNLFLWTGVVCDETILGAWDLNFDGLLNIDDFDFNLNGVIDPQDLVDLGLALDIAAAEAIITAAENAVPDDSSIPSNDNLVIDNVAEFAAFIEIQFGGVFNCQAFFDQWVFNIADLVLYGLDYYNDGAKLVHFRFYPV